MIDWLTLRLPVARLSAPHLARLRDQCGAISVTGPGGECRKRFPSRESVETPFGSLTWKLSDHFLQLEGSPAVLERPNNVFGKRDPRHCALAMWAHFDRRHHADLPRRTDLWQCTRLDVTLNYPLADSSEVHDALRVLSLTHGANRTVSTDRGTCYWNKTSALREGKAYAKGPHLDHLISKRKASAAEDELRMSQILLRLELRLASKFWRRAASPWYKWSAGDLEKEHATYFMPLLANLQVASPADVAQALKQMASIRLASAAYRTWLAVQAHGIKWVREDMRPSTLRKHLNLLRKAGVTDADINSVNAGLPPRHTIIVGQPVHSWDQLREVMEQRNPRSRQAGQEDDWLEPNSVHRPPIFSPVGSCLGP